MIRKVVLCAAVAFAMTPALSVTASAQGYEQPRQRPNYEEPREDSGYEAPRRRRQGYEEPRRESAPYGGCKFKMRPVDTGNGYKEERRVLVCPD